MKAPALGTRWVHRRGGRVCVVLATYEASAETGGGVRIRYRYELGATSNMAFRTRMTHEQTMPFDEWRLLFTVEAPPKKTR